MKTVNSLSGGKTSSYIAAHYPADYDVFSLVRIEDDSCRIKDKKIVQEIEDRIQAPFIATAEDDAIIYTMLDLEQYIGRPITWVTGPTFESTIHDVAGGYLPNRIRRFCTSEMKTKPIASWRYNTIDDDVIMRFGFRANEKSRANTMNSKLNENGQTEVKIVIGKLKDGRNKWKTIQYCAPEYPLIQDNIYKDNIEQYWHDKPVRFAYMNNCIGCWWRTPALLKHMHTKFPNKMEYFSELEKNGKGTFKKDMPYEKIISWNPQIKLFDDSFGECDSGYCGL